MSQFGGPVFYRRPTDIKCPKDETLCKDPEYKVNCVWRQRRKPDARIPARATCARRLNKATVPITEAEARRILSESEPFQFGKTQPRVLISYTDQFGKSRMSPIDRTYFTAGAAASSSPFAGAGVFTATAAAPPAYEEKYHSPEESKTPIGLEYEEGYDLPKDIPHSDFFRKRPCENRILEEKRKLKDYLVRLGAKIDLSETDDKFCEYLENKGRDFITSAQEYNDDIAKCYSAKPKDRRLLGYYNSNFFEKPIPRDFYRKGREKDLCRAIRIINFNESPTLQNQIETELKESTPEVQDWWGIWGPGPEEETF